MAVIARGAARAWPCRAGCDGCCRKLAELPRLTADEWIHLRTRLAALPLETLETVTARLAEQSARQAGPYVCPMLHGETGRCLVYEHRPVACRTYGYYVERDKGLYCGIILEQVERGDRDMVVWGNHAAIEAALAGMGPDQGLAQWWRSGR